MQRRMLAAAVAACLLGGCLESKEIITLNPDGTGKVTFDVITPVRPDFNLFGGDQNVQVKDPDEAARRTVAKLVGEEAEGIDAWKDLAYEIREDGRIHVKGTAYFGDYASVKFPWPSPTAGWQKVEGGMVLETDVESLMQPNVPGPMRSPKPKPSKPKGARRKLAGEPLRKAILSERMEYQGMRSLLVAVLGSMKVDTTYALPGRIVEHGGFHITPDGRVRIVFNGKELIAALDKVVNDDGAMGEAVQWDTKEARDGHVRQQMQKSLFGTDAPLRVKVAGEMKPLFDYHVEAAQAADAMPGMLEKLGISLKPPPAPEGGQVPMPFDIFPGK